MEGSELVPSFTTVWNSGRALLLPHASMSLGRYRRHCEYGSPTVKNAASRS